MASKKVSALTAATAIADDDLVLISQDQGDSTYTSKQISFSNLISGYATESYVDTEISNLIDGAPNALNTLNELAAALNDDASAASSHHLINANETHIDNMATLTGVAKDAEHLGTFSGSTISDSVTIKAALQALESGVEGKRLCCRPQQPVFHADRRFRCFGFADFQKLKFSTDCWLPQLS